MMNKRILTAVILCLLLASCAAGLERGKAKEIKYSRAVNLSHTIEPGIPLWPGDPPVVFHDEASIKKEGYYLRSFSMGEHSATHMNAASSFFEKGKSVDAYGVGELILPAVVIDARKKCSLNPDYQLTVKDIKDWEKLNGEIRAGSLVIFFTGWKDKWDDSAKFLGADAAGTLHFPGFGTDAARYLMDKRKASGLGIDTHGVDPASDSAFSVNMLVFEKDGIVLECLANLDKLPPVGATLIIGALKLKGGSGSPIAVTALIP
jgi:kynurenine formamidase